MLDINLIRETPEVVRKALGDRQMDAAPVDAILALDEQRRTLIPLTETAAKLAASIRLLGKLGMHCEDTRPLAPGGEALQVHGFEQFHGAAAAFARMIETAQVHGQHDIFQQGQHGQELEGLVDNTHGAPAP